jgi:hypothetical protein
VFVNDVAYQISSDFFFKKNKIIGLQKIKTAPKKVGDFTVKPKIKAWLMRINKVPEPTFRFVGRAQGLYASLPF